MVKNKDNPKGVVVGSSISSLSGTGCMRFVSRCLSSRLLVDRPSQFNARVLVVENELGHRVLRFGSEEGDDQSVFDPSEPSRLHLPYARFMAELLGRLDFERVLMIGLGAGSIAKTLIHQRKRRIDVVEIDPVVVEIAQTHLGFDESDDCMQVICCDGRKFVESCVPNSYDLVILDAYGPDQVPYDLSTRQFLCSVLRILVPDSGLVAANVFGVSSLYRSILETYHSVFDSV